jgi:DNA-binding NtrC family response regulator
MSLEEAERLLITKALARFEGNANRAAEALGLSRSELYRRLQKYGLSKARERGRLARNYGRSANNGDV